MRIVYVTGNPGKIDSMQETLAQHGGEVIPRSDLLIDEPEQYDVKQTALHKAREAIRAVQQPLIVNDSGFEISDLDGWPGARVHRVLNEIGLEGILERAKDTDLRCAFTQCIVYQDSEQSEPILFTNTEYGRLSTDVPGPQERAYLASQMDRRPQSDLWFAYTPDGSDKPLYLMTEEERIEHRRNVRTATQQFAEWFAEKST